MYYQHARNAVLDVCAKSVPVWGKSGEMRGLLRDKSLFSRGGREYKMGVLGQTTTFLPLLWRANAVDAN